MAETFETRSEADPTEVAAAATRAYCEACHRDGRVARVVAHRCRNWGVGPGVADQVAEEAASEALARALGHAFDTEGHCYAWVVRTATHLAVDALRRFGRRREWADGPAPVPTEPPPEFERLIEGVGGPEAKEILRLTFLAGLTLDQIAARVAPPGGSANARRLWVKRRRDAALRTLRTVLGPDGQPRHPFRGPR